MQDRLGKVFLFGKAKIDYVRLQYLSICCSIWGLEYGIFWAFFEIAGVAFFWVSPFFGFYGAGSSSARLYFDSYFLDFIMRDSILSMCLLTLELYLFSRAQLFSLAEILELFFCGCSVVLLLCLVTRLFLFPLLCVVSKSFIS